MQPRFALLMLITGVINAQTDYQQARSYIQNKQLVDGLQRIAKVQDKPQEEQNDFGTAITELATLGQAGSEISQEAKDTPAPQLQVFAGLAAKCRDIVLGAMNCCQDTGWANGPIAHCSAQEHKLGQAKEKGGLVVYVGSFCCLIGKSAFSWVYCSE